MNRLKTSKKLILLGILLCFFIPITPNITLAKIFTNNMVLQRDVKVPIWGWADNGETIVLTFEGKKYSTRTDSDNKWKIFLDPHTAGGPYKMVINGKNQIILENIMIGEVWICSGQSNMEFPLSLSNNAKEEIDAAQYRDIRIFTVPKIISDKPLNNLESGEWEVCNPASINSFSAVGYFFGRNLYKELNVPIGLINSSWGGTVAETWISVESISEMEDFRDAIQQLKQTDWKTIKSEFEIKAKQWDETIEKNDTGIIQNWSDPEFNDSDWKDMVLPQLWEIAGLSDFDGVVWFRYEIILDEDETKSVITLNLGLIDDSDISYLNGEKIGETFNQYNVKRIYVVPPKLLKTGKNTIVVRIIDTGGGGGIWGDSQDLSYKTSKGEFSLTGNWKYKPSVKTGPKADPNIGPNSFPTLLFNGMIYPILPIVLRGAIWYQGESNAARAYQYQTLFPLLINDWRKQFNTPELSFLFVQLANYKNVMKEPAESDWAELREAQLKTLAIPNTGMAVIIDIGDAQDIHPKNKQDVGYRLSLPALKMIYNKDIVYSGPVYKSYTIEGNKIRLHFDHIGSGLMVKDVDRTLKGFSIAGADKKFVWAIATIENNDVIVYNAEIPEPKSVRYAWADNPEEANLFNKERLPASPFRTDDWKGITQK